MSTRRTLCLAAVLLLASGATVMAQDGGDQSRRETSTVTFYGHVFGNGLDLPMPANTEAPIGEDNYGIGLSGDCTSADPTGTATSGDCSTSSWNKLALFSTAGFVDVSNREEFQTDGSYAMLHNERGQTKDVLLDTGRSITASVYMTLDTHGWPVGFLDSYGSNCLYPHPPDVPCLYPYWGWDPGIYEDVVLEATLYMANLGEHGANASDAPPIEAAIDSGDATVIAQGLWGPDQVMNGVPGAPNVNEFVIDLGPPQVETIPRNNDFFLVYSVYQETSGQDYFLDGPARWWSGEFFPPTFTIPVKNAFDVERVIPNFAHGKLAILGVMNTPWGSYDIDGDSIELTIEGPGGEVTPERLSRFGDVSFAHGGHYLPINLTWIWDYQNEGLQPGQYTVTVSASNFQHSAQAACSAIFELERAGDGGLSGGKVQEGLCGLQSASEQFIEDIKDGSSSSET